MQEHIGGGALTPEALRAAIYIPAYADFDALLLLSRDALARAPCALLSHKAQRAATLQHGFAPALSILPEVTQPLMSKRSRAMLRALPQGASLIFDNIQPTTTSNTSNEPTEPVLLLGDDHRSSTI